MGVSVSSPSVMAVSMMSLMTSTQCAKPAALSMVGSRVSFIPARRLVSSPMCCASEIKIAASFSPAVLLEPAASTSLMVSSRVRIQSEMRCCAIASFDGKW